MDVDPDTHVVVGVVSTGESDLLRGALFNKQLADVLVLGQLRQ